MNRAGKNKTHDSTAKATKARRRGSGARASKLVKDLDAAPRVKDVKGGAARTDPYKNFRF